MAKLPPQDYYKSFNNIIGRNPDLSEKFLFRKHLSSLPEESMSRA
ncbi:MAG TPA: hypothetical protein VJJ21_02950 [Candidatus Nanoarchaeia archaeon]|nr:hypothetical protein [Candidatus Nanoarchaeia archaeon]